MSQLSPVEPRHPALAPVSPLRKALSRGLSVIRIDSQNTKYTRYRTDPGAYARDVLGITWWDRQIDIANSLHSNRRTVVYAGHSVGKTHGMGGIGAWALGRRNHLNEL